MSKINPTINDVNDDLKQEKASRIVDDRSRERIYPGWLLNENDKINGYSIYDAEIKPGINIIIPDLHIILLNMAYPSDYLQSTTPPKPHQKYHVTIPNSLYNLMMNNGIVHAHDLHAIRLIPVDEPDDIINEIDAEKPGSKIDEFMDLGKDQPSYTKSAADLRANCPWNPPKTLSQFIDRMKKSQPEKLRLIPPAREYKTTRLNKNIYSGPVVEIDASKGNIFIKSNGSTGIKVGKKNTTISGALIRDSNEDLVPQQLTGIPSKPYPLDDFIPKGTVLLPQTKRAPAILEFIQSMLPLIEALRVAISLSKLLKE